MRKISRVAADEDRDHLEQPPDHIASHEAPDLRLARRALGSADLDLVVDRDAERVERDVARSGPSSRRCRSGTRAGWPASARRGSSRRPGRSRRPWPVSVSALASFDQLVELRCCSTCRRWTRRRCSRAAAGSSGSAGSPSASRPGRGRSSSAAVIWLRKSAKVPTGLPTQALSLPSALLMLLQTASTQSLWEPVSALYVIVILAAGEPAALLDQLLAPRPGRTRRRRRTAPPCSRPSVAEDRRGPVGGGGAGLLEDLLGDLRRG